MACSCTLLESICIHIYSTQTYLRMFVTVAWHRLLLLQDRYLVAVQHSFLAARDKEGSVWTDSLHESMHLGKGWES